MSTEIESKNFIIEQLDEALEERQTPERRQADIDKENERRKADRRAECDS